MRPQSLGNLTVYLQSLLNERLWLKILVAMALGVIVGLIISPSSGLLPHHTATTLGNWLALPGSLFLGLIQMIMVPLVFASVVGGLASNHDLRQLHRLGTRLVPYFLITTMVAILIGIAVAYLFKPGLYVDGALLSQIGGASVPESADLQPLTVQHIPSMITKMLPVNPLGAMVNMEMLQIVIFALIIGIALVGLSRSVSSPLIILLTASQEVCMTIVQWTMRLAPLAVFGLITQITMQIGLDALLGVGVYVGTVLCGLWLLLCFYLLIIAVLAQKSPWWFLRQIRDVQLLGFSTSSSAAVMPISIRTAEEKLRVRTSISQSLIPLGATINMDGTALYQGAATIFLAQAYGIELGPAALLLVILTTVGASIGSPATPGVGIVVLSMVLQSVGIPSSGIVLIIGVDRILDMSRTAINVTGDLTAAMVMEKLVPRDRAT